MMRILWPLALLPALLSACFPVNRAVTILPETDGVVVDARSGAPVAGARVRALEGWRGEPLDVPPEITDAEGAFRFARVEENRRLQVMSGSGSYRTEAVFAAQADGLELAFGTATFVHPVDERSDVTLIAFDRHAVAADWVPVADCVPTDLERHAYTLLKRLPHLVEQDWFVARARTHPRFLEHVEQQVRQGLDYGLMVRCGLTGQERRDLYGPAEATLRDLHRLAQSPPG